MNGIRKGAKRKENLKTSQRNEITFSPMVTQAFESKSLGGLKHTDISLDVNWLHLTSEDKTTVTVKQRVNVKHDIKDVFVSENLNFSVHHRSEERIRFSLHWEK